KAAAPVAIQMAVETQAPTRESVTQTTSGGDFMVDVFKALDIDYLAMNCASSFRGLHEAVVNRAENVKPEILTCPHEEIAVHMGQGYAKIEGKPMAMICHGVVGRHVACIVAVDKRRGGPVAVVLVGGQRKEGHKPGAGRGGGASGSRPGPCVAPFRKGARRAPPRPPFRRLVPPPQQDPEAPAD